MKKSALLCFLLLFSTAGIAQQNSSQQQQLEIQKLKQQNENLEQDKQLLFQQLQFQQQQTAEQSKKIDALQQQQKALQEQQQQKLNALENKLPAYKTTREGCKPIINADNVTFTERTYVEVNNTRNFISDCTATKNQAPIQSEPCRDEAYTHDIANGKSFLNKNYFYMDGITRTDLSHCQKSETEFKHLEDKTVCPLFNDDKNKFSKYAAKKYISNNNRKLYVTDCEPTGSPLPYTHLENRWKIIQSSAQQPTPLAIPKSNETEIQIDADHQKWLYKNLRWHPVTVGKNAYACSPHNYCFGDLNANGTMRITEFSGTYCLTGAYNTPWITEEGHSIDSENSDESPTFSVSEVSISTAQGALIKHCSPMPTPATSDYNCAAHNGKITYRCSAPTCNLTAFQLNPIYKRPDKTEYTDTTTVLDTKYICGTGEKLLGKISGKKRTEERR